MHDFEGFQNTFYVQPVALRQSCFRVLDTTTVILLAGNTILRYLCSCIELVYMQYLSLNKVSE
jgi:hypothetical protein